MKWGINLSPLNTKNDKSPIWGKRLKNTFDAYRFILSTSLLFQKKVTCNSIDQNPCYYVLM